jgi:hypothetical protein
MRPIAQLAINVQTDQLTLSSSFLRQLECQIELNQDTYDIVDRTKPWPASTSFEDLPKKAARVQDMGPIAQEFVKRLRKEVARYFEEPDPDQRIAMLLDPVTRHFAPEFLEIAGRQHELALCRDLLEKAYKAEMEYMIGDVAENGWRKPRVVVAQPPPGMSAMEHARWRKSQDASAGRATGEVATMDELERFYATRFDPVFEYEIQHGQTPPSGVDLVVETARKPVPHAQSPCGQISSQAGLERVPGESLFSREDRQRPLAAVAQGSEFRGRLLAQHERLAAGNPHPRTRAEQQMQSHRSHASHHDPTSRSGLDSKPQATESHPEQ